MALRNSLGEAFGTKKAKAAIRARERNRVDVDAMKDVAGHLQDTITQNTDTLPTAGASLIVFNRMSSNQWYIICRRSEGDCGQ